MAVTLLPTDRFTLVAALGYWAIVVLIGIVLVLVLVRHMAGRSRK